MITDHGVRLKITVGDVQQIASACDRTLPPQDQALAALEPGSVLVVWKLDRLGRSMLETVKIVLDLDRRGIGFRSLTESFDKKTALGRGVLALLAVAEDERDRLRERTRAGMQVPRRLIEEGKGRAVTARMIGVDPATLRRKIKGQT